LYELAEGEKQDFRKEQIKLQWINFSNSVYAGNNQLFIQVRGFRFVIELIITSRTEVSDSGAESVVLQHRLSPVRDV